MSTPEKTPDNDHGHEVPTSAADAVRDITSPGVQRIKAMSEVITLTDRIFIFFGEHSLQSSVNTLRAVIAAAAQPTAGKIADVFGRVELICISVFFYTIGTVIEAAAQNLDTYSAGAVIYQIGYTMILLLVEVIIGDITSVRSRLFFSYIPALPFIINTWVSGDVTEAVLGATTWRWGIGMWCIIYPVCALPLIISLLVVGHRAKKAGHLVGYRSSFQQLGFNKLTVELFWLLDIIGVILLIAVFALLLVPLTIAGGFESKWSDPQVVAPLVIGFVCIPVFVVWELRAPHPLVPFHHMKDRSVWAPMGIACMLNFAWTMQGDYLYTVLQVSFNFSIKAATRVQSLYSFASVITGTILGLIVYKVRRFKVFIVAGTCLFLVAFGLLIRYRGDPSSDNKSGVIGAQILLGIAGGMFPYPAQASLQAYVTHERLAVMTGLYLALYQVGSAFGNAVSGAIWTQVLPVRLAQSFSSFGNETLAVYAYSQPLSAILDFPVGSDERDAMIDAYKHVQRLLTITGICLCVPLIAFSLCLRNPKLTDQQNLVEDEKPGAAAERSSASA
ncbi:hypothetical protein AU210_003837 [Fusarium oxysporum f. sp. radicis-cucumerinum]|uniref:Siderophore iron transporter 1 n=1 Tax=Fusarium oxysporum f. sp. radicis-cucumerinum TaxID=327505 RepID=A0A2H3HFZ8_FUSOX|nr:hypothetical protein AU210_003837 [Fusarium oxysporum f. sp. radicis-cucumerinum]